MAHDLLFFGKGVRIDAKGFERLRRELCRS
jgi:hypothetical protein